MKIGDVVRYRRGGDEWIGIIMDIYSSRIFQAMDDISITLVDVAMPEGLYTYKDWKLEVISESR